MSAAGRRFVHPGSRDSRPALPTRKDPSSLGWLLSFLLCFLLVSCSSVQAVQLATTHNYVLLRTQGTSPGVLADDDPLYALFQEQVLDDPYLAMLVSLFEETTIAYASANRAAPVPATAANHLMIVLDSATPGILYDLVARYQEDSFTVELALGLGNQGRVDLPWAQDHMAATLGPLFLGLAGLPAVTGQAAPEEITTPEVALYRGFGAALEATDAQNPDTQARWRSRAQDSPDVRAKLDRAMQIPDNSYRFIYMDGRPTLQLRSREQAMRTPGVVATFYVRLFQRAGDYYPQRYLLWFFGYPPDQVPYAKIILALNAMSADQSLSVQSFIDAYGKTFPADRETVLALADEVFGPAGP